MDFHIIKKAGVTVPEFAYCAKVSRITVHTWVRRLNPKHPHAQIAPRVEKLLEALRGAVAAGDLPLPDDAIRRRVVTKSGHIAVRPGVVAAIKAHL